MTRRVSLTGFIEKQWLEDGKPELTFKELLQRTIAADQILQQSEFNPAERFRQYREQSASDSMLRYIKGFYQYPFAPNFKSRNTERNSERNTNSMSGSSNLSSEGNTDRDFVYRLNQIHGEMEEIVRRLDPESNRPNLATRIVYLTKNKRLIPDYIANLMHSIRTLRNRVFHEKFNANHNEIAAIDAAWAAIHAWWRQTSPSGTY